MNTLKRYGISALLTILLLASGLFGAVFGVVVADIVTEGKIDSFFETDTVIDSEESRSQLAEQVREYVNAEQYEELKRYAQYNDFDYYISSDSGAQIAHSLTWFTNREGEKLWIPGGPNGKYTIQLSIRPGAAQKQENSVYRIWRMFRDREKLCILGFCVCLALFGGMLVLLKRQAALIYKVFLLLAVIGGVQVTLILANGLPYRDRLLLFIAVEKLFLLVLAAVYLHNLEYIRHKVRAISHPEESISNRRRLPGSLRAFSREVDEATESITVAVEERLKSDRLKTELISNVSHDLKTPLTSIINFSDLIVKETTENAAITEYAQHLHRQSIRLKQLMDALIEASKASSGAIEMEPVPCKVKTLLEQCIVEYEDKLQAKGITFVDIPSEEDLMIYADVKALCRIFENLLNNICNYALTGSRAYIEVKREEHMVAITFKNVSAEQINLSAEELTERFVRGDASRHSEGYGLGLSIVKSLMDLLGGGLDISAKYDMFVVKLTFPEYTEEGAVTSFSDIE